ncbi:hypothetical protein Ocin01_02629 [Orchesella cincta]|uniref:Uncharacterized protein n=1 Tax=Orchesella cincta TaxID=48709 RepID=A0A1D2NFM7_ORCCI|nr:hypothetical protein Ocin01_02629 [Orchesella cincta]
MNPRVYPTTTRRIIAVDGGFVTRYNRGNQRGGIHKLRDDRFSQPRGRGRGRGMKRPFTFRHEVEHPRFRQYNKEWSPTRPRAVHHLNEERQARAPSYDRPKKKPFRRSRSRSPQNPRVSAHARDGGFVTRFNGGSQRGGIRKLRDDRFSQPRGRGRGKVMSRRPFTFRHDGELPRFRQDNNKEWHPTRHRTVHRLEDERKSRTPSYDRPKKRPFRRSRSRSSPQSLRVSPDARDVSRGSSCRRSVECADADSTETTTKFSDSPGSVTLYNPAEPTCDDKYVGGLIIGPLTPSLPVTPPSHCEGEVLNSENHKVSVPSHEAIQTVVGYQMKYDCTMARQRYELYFSREVPQRKIFKRIKINLSQEQVYSRYPNFVNNTGMSEVVDLLEIDDQELEGIVIPEVVARTRMIVRRQKLHQMCVSRFGEERMIKLMVHLDIKRKTADIDLIELYEEMLSKYGRTSSTNPTHNPFTTQRTQNGAPNSNNVL